MNGPAPATGTDDEGAAACVQSVREHRGGNVYDDGHRLVAAARLRADGTLLTILYADGGSRSATPDDAAAAADIATELGLTPGGTSTDGVRHWWR